MNIFVEIIYVVGGALRDRQRISKGKFNYSYKQEKKAEKDEPQVNHKTRSKQKAAKSKRY